MKDKERNTIYVTKQRREKIESR